jgi:thioredoxin-dependent peroxiredoxin
MEEKIKLNVGDFAPEFELLNQKGERINLYKVLDSGRKVMLVFYPGDMTPGCTGQLCGIRDVYKEYSKLGVVVYGINHSNAQSHQKFIDKENYPFDILVDENKMICIKYGQTKKFFKATTIKRGVYLIGEDKKIHYIKQGYQNDQEVIELVKKLK